MDSFSTTKLQPLRSRRNKSTKRQQAIHKATNKWRKKNKSQQNKKQVLNIYAELSIRQYRQILNGELGLCVPYGTKMINKSGSKGLFFECDSEEVTKKLIDGLDASGVPWQENE